MHAILLIAHAPLANALRQCALHVFPDCGSMVVAIDVQPNLSPEETLGSARIALEQLGRQPQVKGVLVLADIFGATPSNVAQKLVDGVSSRLSEREVLAALHRELRLESLAHPALQ